MSYSDKLKDPRWQKMRLEIMERDGFKCRKCEAKDKTLHVHHFYYTKRAQPWEYNKEALVTLCEGCHEEVEFATDKMRLYIGQALRSNLCNLPQFTAVLKMVVDHSIRQQSIQEPSESELHFLEDLGRSASRDIGVMDGYEWKVDEIKMGLCDEFQPIPKDSK